MAHSAQFRAINQIINRIKKREKVRLRYLLPNFE